MIDPAHDVTPQLGRCGVIGSGIKCETNDLKHWYLCPVIFTD